MDFTTTVGSTVVRKSPAGGFAARLTAGIARWSQPLLHTPLLLWSLVVAAALLAFFVHLLNEQVLRGQVLREEQRAAATRPVPRAGASVQHPGNLLIVTRQPMTRP